MHALTGPVWAAAGLLVAGGVPKLLRPHAATAALAAVRLPAAPSLVRLLGLAELAAGAAALAAGGRYAAAAVAACYLGFTAFLVLARRRGAAGCGCFGREDTPPSVVHLAVDVALAGLALAASVTGTDGLAALGDTGAGHALAVAALAALTGWFAGLALTLLPRLSAAQRPPIRAFSTHLGAR